MYFVTGTDTNIGKTLVGAALTDMLGGIYWKPIQAGDLDAGGDTAVVQSLTNLSGGHFLPPVYNLKYALSPNQSAAKENIEIELDKINLPEVNKPLIIEGAGGIMVPLNKKHYMLDLMKKFNFPIILVARTGLGTLNHIFLSINMLEAHNLKIKGIVLVGESNKMNRRTIEEHINYPILAEIPPLKEIEKQTRFYKKFFLHKI